MYLRATMAPMNSPTATAIASSIMTSFWVVGDRVFWEVTGALLAARTAAVEPRRGVLIDEPRDFDELNDAVAYAWRCWRTKEEREGRDPGDEVAVELAG